MFSFRKLKNAGEPYNDMLSRDHLGNDLVGGFASALLVELGRAQPVPPRVAVELPGALPDRRRVVVEFLAPGRATVATAANVATAATADDSESSSGAAEPPRRRAPTEDEAVAAASALEISRDDDNDSVATVAYPADFTWAPGERERMSLFPIRHSDVWAFRKQLEALNWTAQEVDLSQDRRDWETRMSEPERAFIRHQLAFFSRFDIDVLGNIDELTNDVDCLEAKFVYAAQAHQECVHAEAYSLQASALLEGDELTRVLNAVTNSPVIARMRDWALRHFAPGLPVGERLAAAAYVEGGFFNSSFASLQWLRERNLLPGVVAYNEFILRDEGVHWLFTCLLLRQRVRVRPSPAFIAGMLAEVVALIDAFIEESLPEPLLGINATLLRQYIRFQLDNVTAEMGYPELVMGDSNPFPFMDKLTLQGVMKTNFFEHQSTAYQVATRDGAGVLALADSDTESEP